MRPAVSPFFYHEYGDCICIKGHQIPHVLLGLLSSLVPGLLAALSHGRIIAVYLEEHSLCI